jgi:hypothetical protein
MTETLIDEFLKGEPPNADEKRKWIKKVWFGEVRVRAHSAEIKALCQGNDARGSAATFCPIRKLWGTGSYEQVPKLLATTHWIPICFDAPLCQRAAVVAQRRLDAEAAEERERSERREATERERKRKSDEDAMAKAQLRMRAERGWLEFNDTHYAQAAEWGMSADMLRKTEQMGFLGSSAPNWQRVAQWLHIRTKYHGLTPKEVIEKDFVPEYQKICAAEARSEAAGASASGGPTAKRPRLEDVDPEAVVLRLKREEEARRRRAAEAAERERTDPHRLALEKIVRNATRYYAAHPLKCFNDKWCHHCETFVVEQFLDCQCGAPDAADWRRCESCMLLVHPRLAPCEHVERSARAYKSTD